MCYVLQVAQFVCCTGILLVCREAIAFGADLCFTADVFIFLFQCEIFEMRWPISMKFCSVISSRPNFIMLVQNFGGPPPKMLGGTTCKIWPDLG